MIKYKKCPCGTEFRIKPCNELRKKYCCNACKYLYRTRPSGLTYNIVSKNPTWFKKGGLPWNTGTVGIVKPNSGSYKLGKRRSIATEFTSKNVAGKNNNRWKGDLVGYSGLHSWVKKQLGKAIKCSKYGKEGNGKEFIHWANVSHKYKRKITDWVQLCAACHGKHDKGTARGAIKKNFSAKGERLCGC